MKGPDITLGVANPEIAAALVHSSLGSILAPKSNQRVEWRCLSYPDIHPNWWATPGARVGQGTGCPACGKIPGDAALQARTLESLGYQVVLAFEQRRHWQTGICGRGHLFRSEVRLIRHGRRCAECRMFDDFGAALHQAKSEGYDVALTRQRDGRVGMTGSCQVGHPIEVSAQNFERGRRCQRCYAEGRAEVYRRMIEELGYPVEIQVRPGRDQNWTWIVGQCLAGHPYEIRGSQFMRSQRCVTCWMDTRRAEYLAVANAEGYAAEIVDVHGGRPRLIGVCPSGHELNIALDTFNQGKRCPGCSVRGFKSNLPGFFYITVCQDFLGNGEVIQFGISNSPNKRLARHASNGFNRDPALLLELSGLNALRLEQQVKRTLPAFGVQFCASAGMKFDGCTESFFSDTMPLQTFMAYVKHLAQLE